MKNAYKKKLIEVAIPLEAINAEAIKEKNNSFSKGHPRALHQYWARRPNVACRALLICQLLNDPSSDPETFRTEEKQEKERLRLFNLIAEAAKWENNSNDELFARIKEEIRRSSSGEGGGGGYLPTIYDPFSGGCAIPIEAQRLGLNAIGSDLNPLAVVIGKASVEIAPKFAGRGPVHKGTKKKLEYIGNDGLAEDISFYGSLIHEQASKELTTIYPKVEVYGNNSNTSSEAIGWMWTRTVPSPDPAFQGIQVPIASTFALCIKEGKEAWLELKVDKEKREYHFDVNYGNGASFDEAKKGTKRGHGANFSCIFSGAAITPKYIRSQGKAGNIGQRLIAVVIKSKGKINYLPPSTKQEKVAISIEPDWRPELKLTEHRPFSTPLYGLERYDQLFTNRQLFGLNTFIRILQEQRQIIYKGRPVKTRFFEW